MNDNITGMIVSARPIVAGIAWRIWNRSEQRFDREDLAGEGMLAVVKLARRFDSSLGVPFLAYIRPRVEGAMLDVYRRKRNTSPATEFVDLDRLPSKETRFDHKIEADFSERLLVSVVETLPLRERLYIFLRFWEDRNQTEVSMIFGLSQGRVSQIGKRARNHLKEKFEERKL